MTPATDAAREARAIVEAIPVGEFPGETYKRKTVNAALVLSALTEAASQPREGDVYDVKCQCVDVLGPDLDCGKCIGSGYYTLRIPQRPPEQAGAAPADLPQPSLRATALALTATPEDFPKDSYSLAVWLDRALSAAPTPPDAGPGEDQYVIRRHGLFFRPAAAGYTEHVGSAGRYTREEADKYAGVEGVTISPLTDWQASTVPAVIKPLRIDWNKHDLAEAYDLVEGVRLASAQHPESGIDGALRDALTAIEAADCEWDGMTKEPTR